MLGSSVAFRGGKVVSGNWQKLMIHLQIARVLHCSGREVKCVGLYRKGLSASDLAQRKLSLREQRPKLHAGRVLTRHHAYGVLMRRLNSSYSHSIA